MKNLVLKIGGSLLYKEDLELNSLFLAKIRSWYINSKDIYKKIIIVVGGGRLSRELVRKSIDLLQSKDDQHGIGMKTTMLNAQLLKEILDDSDDEIIVPSKLGDIYEYILDNKKQVIITGGLKKGWSTDMDAAVFADTLGVDRVHKLSIIEGVYEKNPTEFPDNNKLIKSLSWKEYFKMFNIELEQTEHIPNLNIPIDVVCAQFCYERNLSYFITGGESIDPEKNLGAIFEDGTYIH